jgi:hypothetical protein
MMVQGNGALCSVFPPENIQGAQGGHVHIGYTPLAVKNTYLYKNCVGLQLMDDYLPPRSPSAYLK